MSSFDNITNNKIIFDKQTKKMLDKSETDLKNNNYYNTLLLETSRSNILINNGLISKREGDENSFEKIIHALVDYQFYKNKKKNKKNNKSSYIKNKKTKDVIINNYNSTKNYKIKNNVSQSQRPSYKLYNFNNSKIINNINKFNSSNNSNRNNYIGKIIKSKNKRKKKSLNALANKRYNTSETTLLSNNINQKLNNLKKYNINYPTTTTNKDSKKNKTCVNSNNNTITNIRNNSKSNSTAVSKVLSNSNTNSNINIIHNIKLSQEHSATTNNNNNYQKFTKLTEYLKQIKGKDCNFLQKSSLHKKNCLSIAEGDNTNLLFNINNKNRITKKKITINKNLKITITNGNINPNNQKPKHMKNKTFDYNSVNQIPTNNNLNKNNNIIIINEELNNLLKKQKKSLYKINIDNYNFLSNKTKNNFSKINKSTKSKKSIFSPTSKKNNKISVTQNNSKEKINYNKNLTVNIFSPNNKKRNINNNRIINSPQNKKNNKSVFTKENIINNKETLIKSNKINKTNFSLSPNNNNIDINDIITKNISNHISPTNQLFNSIVYFKRNIHLNSNANNNNIYIKKSINKDNKVINHKKENISLINSCNFNNTTKDLYPNITLPNNNIICNTSNNFNENKALSRNKKKYSHKNLNNSKKNNNIHIKTDSNMNNNPINCNFILGNNIDINNDNLKNNIINNNGNINISIEKNNINIKDSILHINKIYIKKDNSYKKNNKKKKVYDIDYSKENKKSIEIKVGNNIIKTDVNETKLNKDKIKSMDYSPFKKENSPTKVINVHRNNNLITKNNKK